MKIPKNHKGHFTEKNIKRVYEEFKKGNNCWMIIPKRDNEVGTISYCFFEEMSKSGRGKYMDYEPRQKYHKILENIKISSFKSWNFKRYDFYILNKKEIGMVKKEIIVDSMEKK